MKAVDKDNWRPKIRPMEKSTDPHLGNPMPVQKLKRPLVPSDNPPRATKHIKGHKGTL